MFHLNDKKNNNAEILPEENAKGHGRRIIADIVSRDPKHNLKRIVPAIELAREETLILPEKEEAEPPRQSLDKDPVKRSGKIFSKRFMLSSVISAVVLLLSFWSLSTYFSSFTLAITAKTESVDTGDIPILVDTKSSRPNFFSGVIPGEILELVKTEEAEFKSTGKKNIEERARGAIKIYNAYSSSPQKLVATTRFTDDSGKIFKLTKTVTVPGALIENGKIKPSFIEAEAEASGIGEDFNIGSGRFKIPGFEGTPKYETFYGESENGFSGGYQGVAIVISDDDIKKATESVTQSLFNNLKNDITIKVPPGLHLLEPFREVVIENVKTPQKGLRAEIFKVEAKGRARAIVFKDKDMENLVKTAVLANRPDKDAIEGFFTPIFKKPEVKFDKGTGQFIVAGSVKLQSKVETEKIQAFILGKKFGTIEEFLKKNGTISSFQFKSFPFWNFKAPSESQKINILVK